MLFPCAPTPGNVAASDSRFPVGVCPLSSSSTTLRVVYASLAGSLAIAVIKFLAGGVTGSSAMISEGMHSLVDTINEALLLLGLARSRRKPDRDHPLGFGRELYFWSFIVSLLVMALGAGLSLYQGVLHLRHPQPMQEVGLNYLVLALSFLCELLSGWPGFVAFRAGKGSQGYFSAFRASKDPSLFIVVFDGYAALIGLLIAALGIVASQAFGRPEFDGAASIGVGAVLAVSSMLLARETKALLIGEAALPEVRSSILNIAQSDPDVDHANGVMTVQLGPNQIFAALSAEFRDGLDTGQIERCVSRMEAAVKHAHMDVTILFVKPQTRGEWDRRIGLAQGPQATPAR